MGSDPTCGSPNTGPRSTGARAAIAANANARALRRQPIIHYAALHLQLFLFGSLFFSRCVGGLVMETTHGKTHSENGEGVLVVFFF
jgi:hypothetical protein